MPYSKLSAINPALKGIKPKITLAQANAIARWADAMERQGDGPKSPWAVAISQFKKLYRVEDGKWVKKKKKAQENEMDNEWTMASVAQTAIEVGLAVARETDEIANNDAAKKLDLLRSKWSELDETTAPIVSIADVEVDGERVLLSEIIEFYRAGKAAERKPLAVWEDAVTGSVPSHELAIEAIACIELFIAAHANDIVDRTGQQEPDTECKEDIIETDDVPVVEEPLIEFDEGDAEPGGLEEYGHALSIIEGDNGSGAPLKLRFAVIEPGFGNKKMNRYYPAQMLRENAHKFKGVKMYATNHKASEKSVRTEVGIVLDCPVGYTNTGGIIGEAGIFDAAFAQNIRNRAELGVLNSLEDSIIGEGDMRKGKVNGEGAFIVEDIKTVASIDWVTKAGAGGRALEIVENDEGGINMTEEQVEEVVVEEPAVEEVAETVEVEETDPSQDVVETEGEVLEELMIAEAVVAEEVDKTSLPEAFKIALKVREYANDDELAGAITKATDDFKAATGSGKPFGQGQTKKEAEVAETDEAHPMERKAKRLKQILVDAGHLSSI